MIDAGLSSFAFFCRTRSCSDKCLYCVSTTGQVVLLGAFLAYSTPYWQYTFSSSVLLSLSSRGPVARTCSTNREVPPLPGWFDWKRLQQLEPSLSLQRAACGATQVGRTQVGRSQAGGTPSGRDLSRPFILVIWKPFHDSCVPPLIRRVLLATYVWERGARSEVVVVTGALEGMNPVELSQTWAFDILPGSSGNLENPVNHLGCGGHRNRELSVSLVFWESERRVFSHCVWVQSMGSIGNVFNFLWAQVRKRAKISMVWLLQCTSPCKIV